MFGDSALEPEVDDFAAEFERTYAVEPATEKNANGYSVRQMHDGVLQQQYHQEMEMNIDPKLQDYDTMTMMDTMNNTVQDGSTTGDVMYVYQAHPAQAVHHNGQHVHHNGHLVQEQHQQMYYAQQQQQQMIYAQGQEDSQEEMMDDGGYYMAQGQQGIAGAGGQQVMYVQEHAQQQHVYVQHGQQGQVYVQRQQPIMQQHHGQVQQQVRAVARGVPMDAQQQYVRVANTTRPMGNPQMVAQQQMRVQQGGGVIQTTQQQPQPQNYAQYSLMDHADYIMPQHQVQHYQMEEPVYEESVYSANSQQIYQQAPQQQQQQQRPMTAKQVQYKVYKLNQEGTRVSAQEMRTMPVNQQARVNRRLEGMPVLEPSTSHEEHLSPQQQQLQQRYQQQQQQQQQMMYPPQETNGSAQKKPSPPQQRPSASSLPAIPKKKRTEAPVVVAATDQAQAAAVQRIGSEAGWKQMNSWLKAAHQDLVNDGKPDRLRDLLKQCLLAKVSVELLLSNDTPKFVRKLSKNATDSEVKKLAAQCVIKWKKEVANPEVPPPPKKEPKKEKQEYTEELEDEEDMEAEAERKRKEEKEAKKMERRRSSEEDKGEKKEKRNKAKPRIYMAKSRLTGLEGDDDEPPPEKKRKEDPSVKASTSSSTPSEKDKASATVPLSPNSALTSKPKLPKIPKKEKEKEKEKDKKGNTSVVLSMGFMDALQVSADKKKVTVAKKAPPPVKKEVSERTSTTLVLDGLFADQTRTHSVEARRTDSPPIGVVISSSSPRTARASDSPTPRSAVDDKTGKKRIRFADEIGKELVMIKEFEIEEGERINVNRLTPEEMKHHEMEIERKYRNEHIEDEEEPGVSDSFPPREMKEVKYRLFVVEADETFEYIRGTKSVVKFTEEERQKNAMRAFYDPSIPCYVSDEPPEPSEEVLVPPAIIPTEAMDLPEDEPMEPVYTQEFPMPVQPKPEPTPAPAPKTALPGNLQSLIDGLKKKGIVSDSNASQPGASLSTLLPSLSAIQQRQQPLISQIPPPIVPRTVSYQQPPYQAHMAQNGAHIAHNAAAPPPVINGSSIQLVTGMDVHSPALPVLPTGPQPHRSNSGGGWQGGRPCQYFKSPQGCHFGNRCKFSHGDQPTTNNTFSGPARGRGRGGNYRGYGGYNNRPAFHDTRVASYLPEAERRAREEAAASNHEASGKSPAEPMDTSAPLPIAVTQVTSTPMVATDTPASPV